jgi:hypothetical protein
MIGQLMTVATLTLSNIEILDQQINESVHARMEAQSLTYKQALCQESRQNPELFYVMMRLRSGETKAEVLRVEDGKLVPFNYRHQSAVAWKEVVAK